MSNVLYSFVSHIDGKNAQVRIFSDRVEWEKPRGVSGGKVAAGLMTGGLSLFATGVKNGKSGFEMVPVKSITGVSTKRDGVLNTIVSVIASGSRIDFRVSHGEAEKVKVILNDLILGGADIPMVSAPPHKVDIPAQISQLAGLRDQGLLTVEEFEVKKSELLARM